MSDGGFVRSQWFHEDKATFERIITRWRNDPNYGRMLREEFILADKALRDLVERLQPDLVPSHIRSRKEIEFIIDGEPKFVYTIPPLGEYKSHLPLATQAANEHFAQITKKRDFGGWYQYPETAWRFYWKRYFGRDEYWFNGKANKFPSYGRRISS
jgi:hypothetical protein